MPNSAPDPGIPLLLPRSLSELVNEFGGSTNHAHVSLLRVAPPEEADARCLVPLLDPRALRRFQQSAAILVPPELVDRTPNVPKWVHPHARWALAQLLQKYVASPSQPTPPSCAIIEDGVTLAQGVQVGHGAVLLAGSSIGPHSIIEHHAVIYGGVRIGCHVLIGAGAVIGRPGFGWVHGPEGQVLRMPQPGGVEIEDDVEVGPLCTVDAGTLKPTRLRRGCKLDAQVHVGHNVQIGEATIVAAQCGFAGSVTVGDHVLIGGQVGVADHATIGDHARLAGRAGVIGPVPPHATVAGYPAVDRMRWLRAVARMMRG